MMNTDSPEPMHGIYRHYKGALYAVIGFVRDATNGPSEGRLLVLYYSLEHQKLWAREYSQFIDKVQLPDGSTKPRFEYVSA